MSSKDRTAWRKPGAVLVLLGVPLVAASQILVIQYYLVLTAFLPIFPPESLPGVRLVLSLLLLNIGVAFACVFVLVVGAVLVLKGRAAAGGLIVLLAEAPVFVVCGVIGMIGAILGLVGGALGILSAIRGPQKRKTRQPKSTK
jgi:hypothetical protein